MADHHSEARLLLEDTAQELSVCRRLYRVLVQLLDRAAERKPSATCDVFLLDRLVSLVISDAETDGKTLDVTRTKRDVLAALKRLSAEGFGCVWHGRRGRRTRYGLWRNEEEDQALVEEIRRRVGSSAERRDRRKVLARVGRNMEQISKLMRRIQAAHINIERLLSGLAPAE